MLHWVASEFTQGRQFPSVFGHLGDVNNMDSALFEPRTGKESEQGKRNWLLPS
jgi:hypothetical protein